MPVTTRRRAAALALRRPSSLKSSPNSRTNTQPSIPSRRNSQTPLPIKIKTKAHEPTRTPSGKISGHRRRLTSLPPDEAHEIACKFGHRLYTGEAWLTDLEKSEATGASTISPKLKGLLDAGVEQQAQFYERKLAQVSADLAASGRVQLWEVHHVVDHAVGMLRKIGKL